MGSFLSGTKWHKKRTVESCSALDAANLKRQQFLMPGSEVRGTLRWVRRTWVGESEQRVGLCVAVPAGGVTGTVRLSYHATKSNEDVTYSVRLVTTPCHLGGVRWWFICPLSRSGVACGWRVRKLYLVGRYFGCRRCHDLTYTSTQESDPRVYAALRGGIDLTMFDDPGSMSVPQLGLALKVLSLEEKRLGRAGKALPR
jgi:hypothetical protein